MTTLREALGDWRTPLTPDDEELAAESLAKKIRRLRAQAPGGPKAPRRTARRRAGSKGRRRQR